jgi:hypothetical protein
MELDVIWQIATENNYHPTFITWNKSKNNNHAQHTPRAQNNTINTGEGNIKVRITFTYTEKETRYIKKSFKNSTSSQPFRHPAQSETSYFHNHKKEINSVTQEYTNSNVKTVH